MVDAMQCNGKQGMSEAAFHTEQSTFNTTVPPRTASLFIHPHTPPTTNRRTMHRTAVAVVARRCFQPPHPHSSLQLRVIMR